MKLVPAPLLIWIVAALGFPAAMAAALAPGLRWIAIAAIVAIGAAALADALLRHRPAAGIRVNLPELSRIFKDRPAAVRIRVQNPSRVAKRVRVGLPAPPGIDAANEDQFVDLPDGAEAAEFEWRITPRRRGRYLFDAVYLETRSVFGLWSVRRKLSAAMEIRVYPNLRTGRDLRALRQGRAGIRAIRQIGRGRDFEKLREYVPGD